MPPDDPAAVSDRGLGDKWGESSVLPANPPREAVTAAAPGGGAVVAECTKSHLGGIGDDIARLEAMTGLYTTPGLDSTPCLVRAAREIASRLGLVIDHHPRRLRLLLERLVRMYDVLESRTAGPYRLAFDLRPREPLPREVLNTWPFLHHDVWVEDLRALRRGRAIVTGGIHIEEHAQVTGSPDEGMAEELAALGDRIDAARAAGRTPRRMPQVEAAVAALKVHTPAGMARQSGRPLTGPHLDESLAQHTVLLMYHGVYTVLLDARGRPLDVPGVFAPILVPDPGRTLVRRLPPPGMYVSIMKYSSGPYRIDGPRVRKVIGGSLGKLTYRILHVEETHDIQRKIQAYIDAQEQAYIAAVVGPFERRGLSVGHLKDGLVDIAFDAIPHMQREAIAVARQTYENWDEVAAELGEAILREAVVATAKRIAVKIVIKKLGVKLIPIIGAAASIWDLFDDEGTRQDRHLIACVLMYVDGTTADDRELAAMVIARILVRMARDALLDAISGAAVSGGHRLVRRGLESRRSRSELDVPSVPHGSDPTGDAAAPGRSAGLPAESPLAPVGETSGGASAGLAPVRAGRVSASPSATPSGRTGPRALAPSGATPDRATSRPGTDDRHQTARMIETPHRDEGSRPRWGRLPAPAKDDPHAAPERDPAEPVSLRNRPRREDEEAGGRAKDHLADLRPDVTGGRFAEHQRPRAAVQDPDSAGKGAPRRRPAPVTEPEDGKGMRRPGRPTTDADPATSDRDTRPPSPTTAQPRRQRRDPWHEREDHRGREIEDAVGEDDYPDYISTDDLLHVTDPDTTPFKRGRNFPEIDFVSPDGKRSVSVKSVNTFATDFTSGKWYTANAKGTGSMADGAVGHAQSLLLASPTDEVVLDIRVPPETPDHVLDEIAETILTEVGDDSGRLTVVVKRYP